MVSIKYNGTELIWIEGGIINYLFSATSGMDAHDGKRSFQRPADQCIKDAGPIPEGTYVLRLQYNRNLVAVVTDSVTCRLKAATGIQQIPTGDAKKGTEDCTPYWNNWGHNRVRVDPYDQVTRKACKGKRSGFYIHDSHKGYTHGCIEVQHTFFVHLHRLVSSNPKKKSMLLVVDYGKKKTTRGSTKHP